MARQPLRSRSLYVGTLKYFLEESGQTSPNYEKILQDIDSLKKAEEEQHLSLHKNIRKRINTVWKAEPGILRHNPEPRKTPIKVESRLRLGTPSPRAKHKTLKQKNRELKFSRSDASTRNTPKTVTPSKKPLRLKECTGSEPSEPSTDQPRPRNNTIPCCLRKLPHLNSAETVDFLVKNLDLITKPGCVSDRTEEIQNKIDKLHEILSSIELDKHYHTVTEFRPWVMLKEHMPQIHTSNHRLDDVMLNVEYMSAIDERVIFACDPISEVAKIDSSSAEQVVVEKCALKLSIERDSREQLGETPTIEWTKSRIECPRPTNTIDQLNTRYPMVNVFTSRRG